MGRGLVKARARHNSRCSASQEQACLPLRPSLCAFLHAGRTSLQSPVAGAMMKARNPFQPAKVGAQSYGPFPLPKRTLLSSLYIQMLT